MHIKDIYFSLYYTFCSGEHNLAFGDNRPCPARHKIGKVSLYQSVASVLDKVFLSYFFSDDRPKNKDFSLLMEFFNSDFGDDKPVEIFRDYCNLGLSFCGKSARELSVIELISLLETGKGEGLRKAAFSFDYNDKDSFLYHLRYVKQGNSRSLRADPGIDVLGIKCDHNIVNFSCGCYANVRERFLSSALPESLCESCVDFCDSVCISHYTGSIIVGVFFELDEHKNLVISVVLSSSLHAPFKMFHEELACSDVVDGKRFKLIRSVCGCLSVICEEIIDNKFFLAHDIGNVRYDAKEGFNFDFLYGKITKSSCRNGLLPAYKHAIVDGNTGDFVPMKKLWEKYHYGNLYNLDFIPKEKREQADAIREMILKSDASAEVIRFCLKEKATSGLIEVLGRK